MYTAAHLKTTVVDIMQEVWSLLFEPLLSLCYTEVVAIVMDLDLKTMIGVATQ